MVLTRSRLRVEELEGRTLPSVTAVTPPALDGMLAGNFARQTSGPMDGGINYTFSGAGSLDGVGHATISGSLRTTGFVHTGQASGELTLTDSLGTVKLGLLGPAQGGFAGLPDHFQFTVESGTGAYAHLQAGGSIALHLDAHHRFTVDIDPTLDGAVSGSFVRHGPAPVDAGVSYTLAGSGKLAGLGLVTMTGSLQTTGFMANGHASGQVTLTGAKGSVNLDLQGPTQQGFGMLPDSFRFTVSSGTGAYAHLQTGGTVVLHLNAAHHTFTLNFEPTSA